MNGALTLSYSQIFSHAAMSGSRGIAHLGGCCLSLAGNVDYHADITLVTIKLGRLKHQICNCARRLRCVALRSIIVEMDDQLKRERWTWDSLLSQRCLSLK
jgi:hypothetical protein